MGIALPFFQYLGMRAARALAGFVRNWYEGGAFFFEEHLFSTLTQLDRTLALRVTLRYFFTPLYNDRTVIGYILGVIFRSMRVAMASVVYFVLIALYVVLAFVWFAVPPFIIYKIFTTLP